MSLPAVKKGNTYLNSVIWVAKHGSRHMDWNEVPEGIGGELEVAVWHEIIQDKKSSIGSDIPPPEPKSQTPSLVSLWSTSDDSGELVEYSPSVSDATLWSKLLFNFTIDSCVCDCCFDSCSSARSTIDTLRSGAVN